MDTHVGSKPAYAELTQQQRRLYHFQHLASMVSWDRAAMILVATEVRLTVSICRMRTM